MRVYLTNSELESEVGKQLLELSVRIASDGRLDREEIKELRMWLRHNKGNNQIAAVAYLDDIMTRISADGVIDRDEAMELFLAVERVIPGPKRIHIVQARKKREAAERERLKEARRIEREKALEETRRVRQEQYARAMRLHHKHAKVAGVSYRNEDGSERQSIIARCRVGERLILRHDPDNGYSPFATQVLRTNDEQIGFVPEWLAEVVCDEIESGFQVFGVIKDLTGGTRDAPTRGVNFTVFFVANDVTAVEREHYVNSVLSATSKSEDDVALGAVTSTSTGKPWWKFW